MYAGVVRMEMHNINGNHSPNLAARRSRPQHLVNGTGNKTASKGTGGHGWQTFNTETFCIKSLTTMRVDIFSRQIAMLLI